MDDKRKNKYRIRVAKKINHTEYGKKEYSITKIWRNICENFRSTVHEIKKWRNFR